jgi:hypothetical protein
MRKTLTAIGLSIALATAPVPEAKADPPTLAVGISSPYHGFLTLRGVYDFNERVGVQAEIGIDFSGIDIRLKNKLRGLDTYLYAGFIGPSPWMYLLPQAFSSNSTVGLELGVGFEIGNKTGFAWGLEGGSVSQFPSQSNTKLFRVDFNLMYRFPLKE